MNVLVVFASTPKILEVERKQTQHSETPKKEMVSESQGQDLSLKELYPYNAAHCQGRLSRRWDLMRMMRAKDRQR